MTFSTSMDDGKSSTGAPTTQSKLSLSYFTFSSCTWRFISRVWSRPSSRFLPVGRGQDLSTGLRSHPQTWRWEAVFEFQTISFPLFPSGIEKHRGRQLFARVVVALARAPRYRSVHLTARWEAKKHITKKAKLFPWLIFIIISCRQGQD